MILIPKPATKILTTSHFQYTDPQDTFNFVWESLLQHNKRCKDGTTDKCEVVAAVVTASLLRCQQKGTKRELVNLGLRSSFPS